MKNTFWRVWGAVLLIAAVTTFGLLAALLGDGVWDWVSAGSLSVPVAVAIGHGMRRRPKNI